MHVATRQRSGELLDSAYGLRAQRQRVDRDACFAQPFDVGHASIERLDQLAQRRYHEIAV